MFFRKTALIVGLCVLGALFAGCADRGAASSADMAESGPSASEASAASLAEQTSASESESESLLEISSSAASSAAQASKSAAPAKAAQSSKAAASASPSSKASSQAAGQSASSSAAQKTTSGGTAPAYLGVGSPKVANGGEYLPDVEKSILEGINEQRAAVGASPVEWDDNLADAARIRAAELYKNGYTAHTRPDGSRWLTVLQEDVPVGYSAAGEILASIVTQVNYQKIESADYWVNQWVNSEEHYACMINNRYTHAGTGVVYVYDEEQGLYYGVACTIFVRW